MVSFRSPRSQAEHALRNNLAIGESRHTAKKLGTARWNIYSIGTQRIHTQNLTLAANWYTLQCMAGRTGFNGQINRITKDQCHEYLMLRALSVGQKQLDLDRQALEMILRDGIQHLKSVADKDDRLELLPRAYSTQQVLEISTHQKGHNALATEVVSNAGLRAHELFTIARASERPPATHRVFRQDLFIGRVDFQRYTVIGKGGLVREVALDADVARRLELNRLPAPRGVRDRKICYQQLYAIGGGQAWSQSFSSASQLVLRWSAGGHGLRHGYAQLRLEQLQCAGLSWRDALEIVSQEMGHFREDVTLIYLR